MSNIFIGSTPDEQRAMLAALGFRDVGDLYDAVVPQSHQFSGGFESLGLGLSEQELAARMEALTAQNVVFDQGALFAGAGFYQRLIPAAAKSVTSLSNILRAYTSYQAEVSQGVLVTLFDFQSTIHRLTGMDVVNAGLYHGANALAEAVLMALRLQNEKSSDKEKLGRHKVLVSDALHPVALRNLQTYLAPKKGIELRLVPSASGLTTAESIEALVDERTAAVVVQTPNFWGLLDGMAGQADAAHAKKALYIVYGGGDQISLAMLKPPAEYGADIYAGEGQHLGIPLSNGGPHIGLLGIRDRAHVRQLPGRLVGEGVDRLGSRGYVLVLQTREQHIRRENATSNTCTAETFVAVECVAYLALMGHNVLREAAEHSHRKARFIAEGISAIRGFRMMYPEGVFFNEFPVVAPCRADVIVDELAGRGVLAGVPVASRFPYMAGAGELENVLLVSATEATTRQGIDRMLGGLARYGN
ncbi:aminomethyl-transferring glycine dehydrogenase subunit GcvPA [Candidatus Woesearchaeota archaeon]|nr:aminomethyl-transferring glycine dehydrogenase subunit GcvPA [Candidatus Woesearchaeota archaeon]